jgi:hypothetical protein
MQYQLSRWLSSNVPSVTSRFNYVAAVAAHPHMTNAILESLKQARQANFANIDMDSRAAVLSYYFTLLKLIVRQKDDLSLLKELAESTFSLNVPEDSLSVSTLTSTCKFFYRLPELRPRLQNYQFTHQAEQALARSLSKLNLVQMSWAVRGSADKTLVFPKFLELFNTSQGAA